MSLESLSAVESQVKLHRMYKSTVPFIQYVTSKGKAIKFINHVCTTDDDEIIDELDSMIGRIGAGKSNHPHIYIDDKQVEINPEDLDPMKLLEKRIRAQILKEMEDATNTNNDRGSSTSNFAQSINNTVANKAQVSDDKGVLAQLQQLKQTATVVTQQNPASLKEAIQAKLAAKAAADLAAQEADKQLTETTGETVNTEQPAN